MYVPTKKEKKIARELMSISIEKEFDKALQDAEKILLKWKNKNATAREVFHEMSNYLNAFRKHLERRYDDLRGSDYLIILAAILRDSYITEKDLKDFSDEAKENIKRYINLSE